MKKIIYIALSFMIVMFIFCACDTKQEETRDNHLENQNSELTNQESNISSSNELKSEDNKESLNATENKNIEVIEKSETKLEETNATEITNNERTISVEATALSNKTNAWGFVRKKSSAPEIYAPYAKILDDYDGIYLGNAEEKVIYLTFDEGYENGYTASILDTLKEKECVATFFVTMPYVKQNPDLIQRMIDEGHIVGNHSVNHPSMPEVTDDEKLKNEVMELHDYVKEKFSYEMEFFRPPKGEFSERTVAICKELGYRNVLWSAAYADWDVKNQKGSEYAKNMILNYLHNGCVMLLHAVSKDNDAVLGEVIDEIRNRGYEIKALTEFSK